QLGPEVLNFAAMTLPEGPTSTWTVTLIVPRIVLRALLGISGITRWVIWALAAAVFAAGLAGRFAGARVGDSFAADGLGSAAAGAALPALAGGASFPRERISAKAITIAITTPATRISGLRFGPGFEGREVAATASLAGGGAGLAGGATGLPPNCSRA